MAHGRGKKPPTRKEARRPNNKGAVRFGHHMPDKTVERFNPDPNNLPRQRRKLSHGASLGTLGSVWDPINMPVGGIFTLSAAEEQEYDNALYYANPRNDAPNTLLDAGVTYRVEAWSETVKVKQAIGTDKKGEPIFKEVTIETTVTFFRPTFVPEGLEMVCEVSRYQPPAINGILPEKVMITNLIPRDYTVKVDGEVTEFRRHANPNWRQNVSKHYQLAA